MKSYSPDRKTDKKGSPTDLLRIGVTFRRPSDGLTNQECEARLSAASVIEARS